MTNKMREAMAYATKAHAGVYRKYGVPPIPFVHHPRRVMLRLMELDDSDVTEDVLCAAVLHDTIEDDVGTTFSILCDNFGYDVAHLVDELTNVSKHYCSLPRAERKSMDRDHLAQVSRGAKLVKLADRIDNVNDMHGAGEDFKLLYAHESRLLLDALKGTCQELELELEGVIERLVDGLKDNG